MEQSDLRELQAASPDLTLPQALRRLIEDGIVTGRLPSGSHINENALAGRLGVNRAALREALAALVEDGLVEMLRNRGAHVRLVSLDDALHLYDVRAGLARSAGRLAAQRATSADMRALREMHAQMRAVVEAENTPEYDLLNIRFHELLVGVARNPQLARMEKRVGRDIRMYLRRGVVMPQSLRVSNREHGRVIDAIEASDSDAAAASFEAHVLNGKLRMLEAVSLSDGS